MSNLYPGKSFSPALSLSNSKRNGFFDEVRPSFISFWASIHHRKPKSTRNEAGGGHHQEFGIIFIPIAAGEHDHHHRNQRERERFFSSVPNLTWHTDPIMDGGLICFHSQSYFVVVVMLLLVYYLVFTCISVHISTSLCLSVFFFW